MYKVKIIGAGSIGNHLAYACRTKNWDVLMCDTDPAALERTKNQIYPSRYGSWDNNINLKTISEAAATKHDLVIIGTPPDTHVKLAMQVIEIESPKVLLIEKPLSTPSLENCDSLVKIAKERGTRILVGYNHTITQNTQKTAELDLKAILGDTLCINVRWIEHWGGIFSAHPWLSGPHDSYLGFSSRGGGACGEHSHGINIWQHFSRQLGKGRINEVTCSMDLVSNANTAYDRFCSISVKTEGGIFGHILQDVISEPSEKTLRIQGVNGTLEWWANKDKGHDMIRYVQGIKDPVEIMFPKKRTDDFKNEVDQIEQVLANPQLDSPISVERGLETMLVVAASHLSNKLKRTIHIDYNLGYNLNSLKPIN